MKPERMLTFFSGGLPTHPLASAWVAAGGVPDGNQLQAMSALFRAFDFSGAFDWFQLLDGADLTSALIPVIGSGTVTNTGFVSGDYSPATGLKGSNSSVKRLVIPVAANTRNHASGGWLHGGDQMDRTAFRSGMGWQMTGANGHSVWDGSSIAARWGAGTDAAAWTTAVTSGIFVGSAIANNDLRLFHNGSQVAITTATRTAFTATTNLALFAVTTGAGTVTQATDMRGQFFGLLSRGLTAAEVATLSAALATYQATRGRPTL